MTLCIAGQVRTETKKDTFRRNTAIVKLTQNGEPLWAYRYDQGCDDIGDSVREMADGSLIAMGSTLAPPGAKTSFFMLKTDGAGLPLWARSYSSTDSLYASSSLLLENDELLLVGGIYRSPEDTDFFSAKATSSGDIIWSNAYGRPGPDQPISAAKGPPGEFIITGRSGNVKEGLQDGVAMIIDNDGKLKNSSSIGGSLNDDLRSASFLTEGKYCIALSTESFDATYSDILTAVWSPDRSHSVPAFSTTSLPIATAGVELKMFPADFRHIPLSIDKNLAVRELSVESKGARSRSRP